MLRQQHLRIPTVFAGARAMRQVSALEGASVRLGSDRRMGAFVGWRLEGQSPGWKAEVAVFRGVRLIFRWDEKPRKC